MRLFILLIAASSLALASSDKAPSLEIVSRVEPDWGDLTSGYLLQSAEIKITVLPSGEPDTISALGTSIPDPVVRALTQWRFTPYKKIVHPIVAPSETAVVVRIPVRRKLDPDLEHAQSPIWTPSADVQPAFVKAKSLNAESAAKLLADLPPAELPGHPRTTLLVYYAHKGVTDVATAIKARRDMLLWLVHTFPQDEILSSSYAVVNPTAEPLADSLVIPELEKAWLAASNEYPKDPLVAEGAANFLLTIDPVAALRIVTERKEWDLRSNILGDLYAKAGLDISAISPASGEALATKINTLAPQGLAASFRQAILESTDLKLVLSAVSATTLAADQLQSRHVLPAGYDEYCQALMQHTRSLYPQTTLDCSLTAKSDITPTHIVSEDFEKTNLLRSVRPIYSREAKKKHVLGSVRLLALIDLQGNIQHLELLSSPVLLYQETYDAVKQWQYRPPVFAGKPSKVWTQIAVDYIAE